MRDMELVQLFTGFNVWTMLKMILMALAFVPNVTLVFKILVRPSTHTIFNLSLATFFGIIAIFGPLLFYFNFEVFDQHHALYKADLTDLKFYCARMMEFRNAIRESLRIIGVNLMFRFFYVFYADKGLSVRGKSNTAVLRWIYVAFTLGRNRLKL